MIPLGASAVVLGEPQNPALFVFPHVAIRLVHMCFAELDLLSLELLHGEVAEIEHGIGCCLLQLLQTIGQGGHRHAEIVKSPENCEGWAWTDQSVRRCLYVQVGNCDRCGLTQPSCQVTFQWLGLLYLHLIPELPQNPLDLH